MQSKVKELNPVELATQIRNSELHILQLARKIRQASRELDDQVISIDTQISFDETLRNDAQRKARKAELMQSELIREMQQQLDWDKDNLSCCEVELEFLKNQFSIAKLQMRERIATLEGTLEG